MDDKIAIGIEKYGELYDWKGLPIALVMHCSDVERNGLLASNIAISSFYCWIKQYNIWDGSESAEICASVELGGSIYEVFFFNS
jgi:hypothetical protein